MIEIRIHVIPSYNIRDKVTLEEHVEFFTSYSKLEEHLNQNPNLETIIRKAPALVSGHGTGLKVDGGFNDLLKGIKKGSGRNNTINTK